MTTRLTCRGLTGGYGSTTAFRDVDLDIGAGEIEALLGPNGAGKTTMLLTLAGFLQPHQGTVEVDGVELKPGRPGATGKAGVVLVPDNRCLFTTLTVEENLKSAQHKGGRSPGDLLEAFPALQPRRGLKAGSLSGGEQQMLAVARALIQAPKVLLIDEMSMGLAPLIVADLFGQVERIAADDGCAVLLVEQHVNLALEIAQSATVLNRGRVVLRGAAGELLADPDRLEAAYLGSAGEDG
jgi:branched-chain amino acid transport system ATP-binding protein